MKALRALMLVLALSVSAYAGDMDNGRSVAPTPTPTPTSSTIEPTGAAPGAPADAPTAKPSITEVALGLLQSLLLVF